MTLPPRKPTLTARQADRLTLIRLRMAFGRELENRGITAPAEIGAALGVPSAEATRLLIRHQWREGDVALLGAALGPVSLPNRSAYGGPVIYVSGCAN